MAASGALDSGLSVIIAANICFHQTKAWEHGFCGDRRPFFLKGLLELKPQSSAAPLWIMTRSFIIDQNQMILTRNHPGFCSDRLFPHGSHVARYTGFISYTNSLGFSHIYIYMFLSQQSCSTADELSRTFADISCGSCVFVWVCFYCFFLQKVVAAAGHRLLSLDHKRAH